MRSTETPDNAPPGAEHRSRVLELFHAAADLPEPEQQQLLERECAGDAGLEAEVLALLAADRREGGLLDRPMVDIASRVLSRPLPAGQCVGPYRIVRLLGEGGMGVVYLAEREDLGSQAAIKVLRDAWVSPARRRRFEAEQRTLAQLIHPGIAQLHDAGTLPDGTPWLAMELVDGVPLGQFCRDRCLDLRGRLGLFRAVCDAVQYAHQHAVIHRDVKPSNILVTREGAAKLLDFGIAKQLADLETPVDHTRTGLRLMTPAYAAPEQLDGGRVGVHTDVYSLGVILYELLTGRLPFDLAGCTPEQAIRAIRTEEVVRPSLVSTTSAAPIPLAGRAEWPDLDVLCLTAMHRDPERRYRSVEALARDVDHFLRNEPMEARPDTLRYRTAKFLRRRWRPAAALALGTLFVLLLSTAYAVRLAQARNTALDAAARAQHVQQFMQALFEGGDRQAGPARDLRVLTLIERGARHAELLAGEPATQADLFATLGATFRQLGALAQADASLTRALERHRAVLGPDDPAVGEDLVSLGLLRLDQSKLEDAERLVREGLTLEERRLPRDHPAVGRALVALGQTQNEAGKFKEAMLTAERLLTLRSRPGSPALDRAEALQLKANVHLGMNEFAAAEQSFRAAFDLTRDQLGRTHPLSAERLAWVATSVAYQGRLAEAEPLQREVLQVYEQWYGAPHPRTAGALSELADTLTRLKRFDDAEPLLRRALDVLEKAYGEASARVGETVYSLATLEYFQKRYDESIRLCRRAQAIFRNTLGEAHTAYGMAYNCEAVSRVRTRAWAEAEVAARTAREILVRTLPERSPSPIWSDGILGLVLARQHKFAEAEPHSLAAYEFYLTASTKEPVFWTGVLASLVEINEGFRRPEVAARYRRELAEFRAAHPVETF